MFCGFRWTRPINIKTHLLAKHRGKFNAEILITIQALRGRMIVAFLDGYDQGPGMEVEFHFPVPLTSPILMYRQNSSHGNPRHHKMS